jgi:nucleotide sugar dehydrogenase
MKKIGVIGAGVVGMGMVKLFENRFDVKIYDPNYWQYSENKDDISLCDLAVICVPTPMNKDGSCDISAVEESVAWCEAPLILIKSTVPPGTTDYLAKKYNKNVCFSPEYMGESSYFTPYWKYPDPERAETHTFVIVGGETSSRVLDFFMKVMSVDTKYMAVSAIEAELAKYMENSFFATKVTFCNEFFNIARLFGVDYKRLRELWLLDPRINPNHTLVFEDKRGYGGKCLPKDISAIVKASEAKGYTPELLTAVINTNENIKN